MKKIALMLVLVLAFGALFSCSAEDANAVKSAAEIVADAQEAIGKTPTKMVAKYSFTTDNEMLRLALNAAMPYTETVIDGDNRSATVKLPNTTGIGGDFLESTTVIVGDKVYVNANGIKTVTTLNKIALEALLLQKSSEMVDFSEFIEAANAPEMVTEGDKITITFEALKDGKGLDTIAPGFDKLVNGEISLANMKGLFIVNNGNIEKYEISFDITAGGESVSCKIEFIITTEGVGAVTAPADADTYTESPSIPGLS